MSEGWREQVRRAAREAAFLEADPEGDQEGIPFVYRWEHVQAVVRLAVRLAELTGADSEVVEAAAWLHDVAKAQGKDHGAKGAIVARRILAETDFAEDKVEAVADTIAKHVGLWREDQLEPVEAAVLWDADKLSKLGATAVLHFTGYAINVGEGTTEILLARLPWDGQKRIAGSLQTAPARAAGQKRLELYLTFCERAELEYSGDDLGT